MIEATDSRVRSFGTLFAVIGVLIVPAVIYWKRGMWTDTASLTAFIGLLFHLSGRFAPSVLRPLYVAWMKLALILNWIMTRVIISVVYVAIMSPIGLIRRLSGASTPAGFHRFKDPTASTYWIRRNPDPPSTESYYRQY